MAAFWSDTFTDADGTAINSHTSESGHSYETHATLNGPIEIRSNRVHATSGQAYRRPVVTPPSADYEHTALLYCHTDDGQFVSIGVRGDDSELYSVVYNLSDRVQIWSASSQLSTGVTVAPQPGDTIRVKCAIKGSLIRGFLNRFEFAAVTDANVSSAGKPMFGFQTTSGNTTGIHIDSAYANAQFDEDQILFIGDSLTLGEGLTHPESYPYKVIAGLADGATDWSNRGISGQTAATILSNIATYTNLRRPNATRDIAVLLAGTNDLAPNGSTVGSTSTLLTNLYAIADALTAAGFRVVMQTIPYADESSPNIPSGFNAAVDVVNEDLLSNYGSHSRAIVDTNEILGESPSANFQADGVHTTDAGTTLQAAGLVEKIQAMERPVNLRGLTFPLFQASI